MGVMDDRALDGIAVKEETRTDIIRKRQKYSLDAWLSDPKEKGQGRLLSHVEGWVQALSLATGQTWEG